MLLGPWLQLYQVHSATFESGVLEDRGVLEELGRLRDSGVRMGLTLSGPRQAEVLAQPWVSVVLSGATTVEQLQSNMRALEVELGVELLERLRGLVEGAETYWEKRASLPWN